jgi:hypothetical protein
MAGKRAVRPDDDGELELPVALYRDVGDHDVGVRPVEAASHAGKHGGFPGRSPLVHGFSRDPAALHFVGALVFRKKDFVS